MARFVFGRADLAEYTKQLESRWLDKEDNIDIYKTLLIIRWFNERGKKLALFQDRIIELERENQLLKRDNPALENANAALIRAAPDMHELLEEILNDPRVMDLNDGIFSRIQSIFERLSPLMTG